MTRLSLKAGKIAGFHFLWRPRVAIVLAILAIIVLVLGIFLLGTGTMKLSPSEVTASLFGISDNQTATKIIHRIRLPRLVTGLFVGACLGIAGAIFQSISRNSLGSPDIIGFTAGAATGAVAQIILFDAGPFWTSLAAFLGGIVAALMVLILSANKKSNGGGYRLILVGIGIGATFTALNTILLVRGNLDQAVMAQLWLSGSLNTRTWAHATPVMLAFLCMLPFVFLLAKPLNLMEMGDASARQIGVNVERTRLLSVILAVSFTAFATAAAGPIAFVALAGPQLARRLTLAPETPLFGGALMGAVLLLAADLLSQRLPLEYKLPIGLTTGLLGGAYLLWLLTQSRKI